MHQQLEYRECVLFSEYRIYIPTHKSTFISIENPIKYPVDNTIDHDRRNNILYFIVIIKSSESDLESHNTDWPKVGE